MTLPRLLDAVRTARALLFAVRASVALLSNGQFTMMIDIRWRDGRLNVMILLYNLLLGGIIKDLLNVFHDRLGARHEV